MGEGGEGKSIKRNQLLGGVGMKGIPECGGGYIFIFEWENAHQVIDVDVLQCVWPNQNCFSSRPHIDLGIQPEEEKLLRQTRNQVHEDCKWRKQGFFKDAATSNLKNEMTFMNYTRTVYQQVFISTFPFLNVFHCMFLRHIECTEQQL